MVCFFFALIFHQIIFLSTSKRSNSNGKNNSGMCMILIIDALIIIISIFFDRSRFLMDSEAINLSLFLSSQMCYK